MNVTVPTDDWRARKAEEKRAFAAGEIPEEECYMAQLFPDEFIQITDTKLRAFVAALATLPVDAAGWPQVMQAVQSLVLELNAINEDFNGEVIETDEREALCAFIEEAISARGIDLDALAASQHLTRHEITDEWREW